VNDETFGTSGSALAATDVSAIVRVTSGPAIVVERAMYLQVYSNEMAVGHESAGVTAPAIEWYFAEGATGPYFDLFLLIANVESIAAEAEVTYYLPGGTVERRRYTVAPLSRFTVWVDFEGERLADTALAMKVESVNGVPIIAERAMYWPFTFPTWGEAHASHGATAPASRWAIAAGDATTGTWSFETYLLVANVSAFPARVRVSLVAEGSSVSVVREYEMAPASRLNVFVNGDFPTIVGHRFGGLVEGLPETGREPPVGIVVERSIYGPYRGGWYGWELGANALATPVP
jgi:hypothetical protein